MLSFFRQLGFWVAGVVMAVGTMWPGVSLAAIDNCQLTAPLTVVQPGVESQLNFEIINSSAESIRRIELSRPNFDYILTSSSVEGWSLTGTDTGVLLTEGEVRQGQSVQVKIWVEAHAWEADPVSWYARVSDRPDGLASFTCGSDARSAIEAVLPPDRAGLGIGDLTAEPTTTSAIVRWRTIVPTGTAVSYGLDTDLGSVSGYQPGGVLDHLVVISGLRPGTRYFFRVVGADESGVSYFSNPGQFTTLAVPSLFVPVNGQTADSAGVSEAVPPQVTVETRLDQVFTGAVMLHGTVKDNAALVAVQYTLDGGVSWRLVTSLQMTGARFGRFTIMPEGIEDGNYQFGVRAVDSSGNATTTPITNLIIDRQPPVIDAELISFDRQPAQLSSRGHWLTAVGVGQRITLHVDGGAVDVAVSAMRTDAGRSARWYNMRRSPETGLWQAHMQFETPGIYRLEARAVDGAHNAKSRTLHDVVVSRPSYVRDARNGQPLADARVTVFRQTDDTARSWVTWDGLAYGMANPQAAGDDGSFGLVVPPGRYYLRVEADGYQPVVTHVFTASSYEVYRMEVGLHHWRSWPWRLWDELHSRWVSTSAPTAIGDDGGNAAELAMIGSTLPDFWATTSGGERVNSGAWRQRPTLVSILHAWDPTLNTQLTELAGLANVSDVRILPLLMTAQPGYVVAGLSGSSKYSGEVLFAASQDLPAQLAGAALLTHLAVDQSGKIRGIRYGFYQAADLRNWLAGL